MKGFNQFQMLTTAFSYTDIFNHIIVKLLTLQRKHHNYYCAYFGNKIHLQEKCGI